MKKTIIIISGLILMLIGILILLEMACNTVPNIYTIKRDQIKQNSSIKTLIIGPSVMQNGLDPNLFEDEAYNFSFPGLDVELRNHMLKYALELDHDIEHVIMSINYADFPFKAKVYTPRIMVNYYKFFKYPEVNYFIKSYGLKKVLKAVFGYHLMGNEVKYRLDEKGFLFKNGNNGKDVEDDGKFFAKRHTFADKQYRPENVRDVNEMVELCRTRGINLILLSTPCHATYRQYLEEGQMEFYEKKCTALAAANDHVYFANYTSDDRFKDEHYFNAVHLNYDGAQLLSQSLDSLLRSNVFGH